MGLKNLQEQLKLPTRQRVFTHSTILGHLKSLFGETIAGRFKTGYTKAREVIKSRRGRYGIE